MDSSTTAAVLQFCANSANELRTDIFDRRRRQIQYLTLYLTVLGGLLAAASMGVGPDRFEQNEIRVGYAIIGMAIWVGVLVAGACFVVFLGHTFRGIVIANKNIAFLRQVATSICASDGIPKLFCDRAKVADVPVSAAYLNAHYWMLIPNLLVAIGGPIPFLYQGYRGIPEFEAHALGHAIASMLLLVAVVAQLYPRTCVNYATQLRVAEEVDEDRPEVLVRAFQERAWSIAKASGNLSKWRLVGWILFGLDAIALLVLTAWRIRGVVTGAESRAIIAGMAACTAVMVLLKVFELRLSFRLKLNVRVIPLKSAQLP